MAIPRFRPLGSVPSFDYAPSTFGQTVDRMERAKMDRRKLDESERSNLADEGLQARGLAVNERHATVAEDTSKRAEATRKTELQQLALTFKQQGKHVEADEIWRASGDPIPDWSATETAPAPALPGMVRGAPPAPPDLPTPGATPTAPAAVQPPGRAAQLEAMTDPGAPPAPPAAPPPSSGYDMDLSMMTAGPEAMGPPAPPEPPSSLPGMVKAAPPAPAEPEAPLGPPSSLKVTPSAEPPQAAPMVDAPAKLPGSLSMGERLKGQADGDAAAIVGMFDQLAAGEGPINQQKALQVKGMAAEAWEAVRRSGGTLKEAADMLLNAYVAGSKNEYGYAGTQLKADSAKEVAALKKKGGGKGTGISAPGVAGLPPDRRYKLFDRVRGTTKDAAAFAKAPMRREALAGAQKLGGLLDSNDPLTDKAAFTTILQGMFKGATSDQEKNFLSQAGGLSAQIEANWNKWADEGRLPESFKNSARAFAQQSQQYIEAQLEQDGRALGENIGRIVKQLEPSISESEYPLIARDMLLGADSGPAPDAPAEPAVEIPGVRFDP